MKINVATSLKTMPLSLKAIVLAVGLYLTAVIAILVLVVSDLLWIRRIRSEQTA